MTAGLTDAEREHWLIFDDERRVTGCHCGFQADMDADCGWGDSVVEHLMTTAITARLAEAEASLKAARSALAAVREVAQKRAGR